MILTCHGQLVKNQCTNRSIDMNNNDRIIALHKGRILKEVLQILNEKNLSEINKKRTEIIHLKNNIIDKLKKAKEIKKIYHSETNFIFMKVMNAENFCKKFSSKGIIIRLSLIHI